MKVYEATVDVPTNGSDTGLGFEFVSNYATLTEVDAGGPLATASLSNGNLTTTPRQIVCMPLVLLVLPAESGIGKQPLMVQPTHQWLVGVT